MLEIESKAFIPKGKVKRILKLANQKFKFIKKELKEDVYYCNKKKTIRIRKFNSLTDVVTFKTKYLDNDTEVNKEIEFRVDNTNDFVRLLEEMEFKILYKKIKKSIVYKKENLTIEINEIENLGFFLEVEKIIKNRSELALAKAEIHEIIEDFQLENNIEKKSYFELLGDQFKI
ncbi:class IV adenylate cyclase [Borrelia sp. BU AG58]|uniref:class IV adenylate cyclase n=1 Tax=Borrelia sp. BU AG58 TaxID=2887345 RepID=UPI002101F67B|nr:class IV adenylate cyclase [Borrelia sp. BU AG58]UER67868.1 class IV adenylate cyclase [Borrelia sp. BU AG58]